MNACTCPCDVANPSWFARDGGIYAVAWQCMHCKGAKPWPLPIVWSSARDSWSVRTRGGEPWPYASSYATAIEAWEMVHA